MQYALQEARAENAPYLTRDLEPWASVLGFYGLGRVLEMTAGGGTAAAKVVAVTPEGRFLLRCRRPAMSEDEVVAFDHSTIRGVVDHGLPSPLPKPNLAGRTWTRFKGRVYELFPWVEGLQRFQQEDLAQIASAGWALGLFHQATGGLSPSGAKPWPREHRIQTMRDTLAETLLSAAGSRAELADAEHMLWSAQKLSQHLTDEVVQRLPQVIIHGDFTPANVMFAGDRVAGIFDYDWVSRQPRLVDLGEALQFFAFRRVEPINPDSIWSLVQDWKPDLRGARIFLANYQYFCPLDDEEAQFLPYFMRETWLGVHIRAMRKVAPTQRLAILAQGALAPLHWLESNVATLQRLVRETR